VISGAVHVDNDWRGIILFHWLLEDRS
jgi:hypothetical protein